MDGPARCRHKKAPDDAGALMAGDVAGRSVLREQGAPTEVEQGSLRLIFEDMLVRLEAGGATDASGNTVIIAGNEGKLLRTEFQIVVFELDRPILGQRMFDADTDKKTIQGAARSRTFPKMALH